MDARYKRWTLVTVDWRSSQQMDAHHCRGTLVTHPRAYNSPVVTVRAWEGSDRLRTRLSCEARSARERPDPPPEASAAEAWTAAPHEKVNAWYTIVPYILYTQLYISYTRLCIVYNYSIYVIHLTIYVQIFYTSCTPKYMFHKRTCILHTCLISIRKGVQL